MLGELIDEWDKTSRAVLNRSSMLLLLAMWFLLLIPVLAQAATPVAISDPELTQLALTNPSPLLSDQFGCAVSVSGNTAVVGAPSIDGSKLGRVHVYVFNNGSWRLQDTIASPGLSTAFGSSVAVSGDNLIVGAPDMNGDRGMAVVYSRRGSTWTFQRLVQGYSAGDRLGCSVGASGNTFIVGAPGADWTSDDDSCRITVDVGAAYVFTGNTSPMQELDPLSHNRGDYFGCSVSISGNGAIVGARNYDGYDNSVKDVGLASMYQRNSDGSWTRSNSICPPDGQEGANFGASVAISGDTVLIGSPFNRNGSAYVYAKTNGCWASQAKLKGSGGRFGWSVSLSGDTAVVGAPVEYTTTRLQAGAVHYYTRRGTTWGSERVVFAPTPREQVLFGSSVGISGSNAVVGEPLSKEAFIHANLLSYSVNEDATLTVPAISGILLNDQATGATPQLIKTKSLHGMLKLAKDGSFVYKPEADFDGTATARYRLINRSKASKSATITIVVNPLQKPPVARDDFFTITPDDVLLKFADEGEGLLANDTDVDRDKIQIAFRPYWPKHAGWLGILPDGSFSYVPRAGFVGTDTFRYTITDGHGGSDSANVTIKVGTGEPPVAMSDSELNQFKLFAVDPGYATNIGWSVAVSGDTAIVGTKNVTTPTVYAYNRSGSVWNLEQRLLPPFLHDTAGFGSSVSVSGNTMVIGAAESGMAYVYTRGSELADWLLETTLEGPALENFGRSVSVSGDTIVVGADAANVGNCSSAGAAYVYTRNSSGWGYPVKLNAKTVTSQAFLGFSVTCSGDEVILGAPGAPSLDSPGVRSGGAIVFTRTGTTWDSGTNLPGPGIADAAFGHSVSISGDTAVVGAWNEHDSSGRWGATYVFTKLDGRWLLQRKLTEEGAGAFGDAVSVSDDSLIIGAPQEAGSGAAAYLYDRRGNTWSLRKRLTSSETSGSFGFAVCASGGTAMVGAPYDYEAGTAYIETGLSPYVTEQDTSLYVPASSGVLVNDPTVDLTPELVDDSELHGSLEFLDDGGGAFVYDPDPGFAGIAIAKYRVTDGERTSAPATITIVVNAPNRPPIAQDDTVTVTAGSTVSVPAPGVLGNDTDDDGDELIVLLDSPPRRKDGFSLSADGSYRYVSDPKDRTNDSFTYVVSDGRGGTDIGRVNIVIVPAKPPVR